MKNIQLLLICSILSASIFAMESNEEVLWQQLHEVYEEQSDNIAELFFTTLDTKKADTAAFYNAVCTWRALPIARKLLHLQKYIPL